MSLGDTVLQFLTWTFSTLTLNNPANFGQIPDANEQLRFQQSPQFDSEEQVFVNRQKDAIREMRKRAMNPSVLWQFVKGGERRVPKGRLPSVKTNFTDFLQVSEAIKFVWFGHSSFLTNIEGVGVLFDPVFSKTASPFQFATKRFQEPPVTLADLPEISFIVISHDHYDHLDRETIEFFAKKETQFIVPLGVGAHLKFWGVPAERISELDWWQSRTFGNLEFTAAPAQHFSGRGLVDNAKSLWASWVVKGVKQSLFYSGDTGYDLHFKEIGERLGPFDLAVLENGQYNPSWREVHMLPEEVQTAFRELKGERLFTVHWGMFELSLHPWDEPIEKAYQAMLEHQVPLLAPMLGEIVDLSAAPTPNPWWREVD